MNEEQEKLLKKIMEQLEYHITETDECETIIEIPNQTFRVIFPKVIK